MNNFKGKSIIIFDGVCNLCNSAVNFIIKHDPKEHFLFASLQSDVAKEILLQFHSEKTELDSVILIENNIIYDKSTAALLISKQLNDGYKLIYYLIIIPKFLRDFGYKYIANNRYKWFGRQKSCYIPSLKIKNRFLDFNEWKD